MGPILVLALEAVIDGKLQRTQKPGLLIMGRCVHKFMRLSFVSSKRPFRLFLGSHSYSYADNYLSSLRFSLLVSLRLLANCTHAPHTSSLFNLFKRASLVIVGTPQPTAGTATPGGSESSEWLVVDDAEH